MSTATAKRTEAGEPAPQPVTPDPTPAEEVQPTAPDPEPVDLSRPTVPVRGIMGEHERDLTVGEAIAEVTRRVPAIAKDRTADRSVGGYSFRGIDDALEALHPILGAVGLCILPGRVVREVWETRATSTGGTLNVARLLVRYTFVGPDGTTLDAEVWGEAGDSGDKATQKAHSQSYKTLVFQAFSIPTEDSRADEPDATGPAARPFTMDEVERAERAHGAAIGAVTVEALAGVRRRALELLPVPVTSGDRVAPLGVWFDLRRAELEGAQS